MYLLYRFRELEHVDKLIIFQLIVKGFYRDFSLDEHELKFLSNLDKELIEAYENEIFIVDMRNNLNPDLIKNLEPKSQKYLIMICALLGKYLSTEDSDAETRKFFDNQIIKNTVIDQKLLEEIQNKSIDYFKSLKEISEFILYEKGFWGAKKDDEIKDANNMFVFDSFTENLEKNFCEYKRRNLIFLIIFEHLFNCIQGFKNGPEEWFWWSAKKNIYPETYTKKLIKELKETLTPREILKISESEHQERSEVYNKIHLFFVIIKRISLEINEEIDKSEHQERYTEYLNIYDLQEIEKKLVKLIEASIGKQKDIEKLIDNQVTKIKFEEDVSTKIRLSKGVSKVASSVALTIPPIALANAALGFVRTGNSFRTNVNTDHSLEFGLYNVSKKNTNNLIICIDGFLSERSADQFQDWMQSINAISKEEYWIKGFKWPSGQAFDSTTLSSSILPTTWWEKVAISEKAGAKLALEIEQMFDFNSNLNITLMGHSLGARVAYYALVNLIEKPIYIDSVYFFGGAVSALDYSGWNEVSQKVNKFIYNFRSNNDDVLKYLYSSLQKDPPIGLEPIKYNKLKGMSQCEIVDLDVSEKISGHTVYKNSLDKLIECI